MSAVTRADWLEERRNYLGGTDIAALVGKNKYKSPLAVWESKVLGSPEAGDQRAAEMGILLEPLVRSWFEADFKVTADLVGSPIYHPEYPYLAANVDGLIADDAILDVKTHGIRTADEWGEEMSDQVPDAYHIQCVWYLGITGRSYAVIAACNTGTREMHYHRVDADPEYFRLLVALGKRFWTNHVLTQTPPPAVGHPTEVEVLNRMHPRDNGNYLIGGPAEDSAAETYLLLTKRASEVYKERDKAKAILVAAIGDASGLETLYGRFTYHYGNEKRVTDWDAVCQEANVPKALIEKHTTTQEGFRTLRAPRR